MSAIINLLANVLMTGTSIIGIATIVNKVGKFCKFIDENKKDGFKLGFDAIMLDTINDINNCVESIGSISNNVSKVCFTLYDISVGNKYIKKDKDGKILICGKSKIYSGFKDKIEELNDKVKKYEQELGKLKKSKKKQTPKDNNLNESSDESLSGDDSDKEDNTYSDVSSEEVSEDEEEEESKNKDDEFFLESKK